MKFFFKNIIEYSNHLGRPLNILEHQAFQAARSEYPYVTVDIESEILTVTEIVIQNENPNNQLSGSNI